MNIWDYYIKKQQTHKKRIIPSTIKIHTTGRHKLTKTKRLISNKFCNCLKKLEPSYGPRSIGICTASIFNKKGLKRKGQFTCKPNNVSYRRVRLKRTRKNIVH